jgi:hypothetical protein
MKMERVDSSNLKTVGYDPASQVLRVGFHGGRTYEYEGVTPEAHKELMESDSKGQHFHRHIRAKHEGRLV